jgi:hypothetical protein
MIGQSFLLDEQDDGQRQCATVVKLIEDHANSVENSPIRLKFLLSINNETVEHIITYRQLLDYLAKDMKMRQFGSFVALYYIKEPSLPSIKIIKDQHMISKSHSH